MSHCRSSFESGFHSRPVTSAGTGCEQLAQLGAALVVSVMLHDRSVPVSMVAASVTSSIQVPLAEIPFRAERGTAGWNEPVYGAVPVPIGPAAASSKTVFVRLSPPLVEPPTRFAGDARHRVGPVVVRDDRHLDVVARIDDAVAAAARAGVRGRAAPVLDGRAALLGRIAEGDAPAEDRPRVNARGIDDVQRPVAGG